jgi:pimeloyl-ACP methyl ester carboxylesterase
MTIVLVHGAYRGAWLWSRLTPLLAAAGHLVFAPTLDGLGERAQHIHPGVGLAAHVDDIVGLIDGESLAEVLLVGASYGGMVITGAAGPRSDRIRALLYLDAPVARPGEALWDLFDDQRRTTLVDAAVHEGEGWRVPARLGRPAPGFADTADEDWIGSRLTDQPLLTFLQPLPPAGDGVPDVPRFFVRCTGGPSVPSPVARSAERVGNDPDWVFRTVAAPHDAMVTHPDLIAAELISAGRHAGIEAAAR